MAKTLKENGIEFKELWGVQANPVVGKAREGIAIAKDPANKIDAVLAVGGGSVIDTSKAICGGAHLDGDIYDVYEGKIPVPQDCLPLYIVLTLSATGSEFNVSSVISNPEKKEKLGVFFKDTPVVSAIDPSVQLTLPWRQVMCGAVDATSHLMESMFHSDDLNITTRQINFALQKSIQKSMELMLINEKDYNAKENFAWAASVTSNSLPHFGNCGDWNVHFIEHCVSAFNDKIAHGEGLAVLSCAYYPIMYKKGICKKQLEMWSEEVMGEKDPLKGFEKYTEMLRRWKAPLKMKDIGITKEEDLKEIVKIFAHHREFKLVSPVFNLTDEDVMEILKAAC